MDPKSDSIPDTIQYNRITWALPKHSKNSANREGSRPKYA